MRALTAVLLVLGSTVAAAQGLPRGGGGMGGRGGMGGGRGGPGMGGRMSTPPNPTVKDVQKQDPVWLLLDKKKKLKLDKDQVAQLTTLDAKLKEQNAPLYVRVDSLHDTFKAPSGGFRRASGTEDDRGAMMENRQLLYETLREVRENNRVARNDAIALLKEPQKKKAYDLLEKQLEKSDEMLRGPGGEGGMGGRPRGRPPA